MEIEIETQIGQELSESECYALKIGFNAAVVSTLADALSDSDEMKIDTLIEALAAESAAKLENIDDSSTALEDLLTAIVERIFENIGDPDSSDRSLAVTGFELTMECALGEKGCDGCCRGCSCGRNGD